MGYTLAMEFGHSARQRGKKVKALIQLERGAVLLDISAECRPVGRKRANLVLIGQYFIGRTNTGLQGCGVGDEEAVGLAQKAGDAGLDRTGVVAGQGVSVRVDLGGRRIIKKKTRQTKKTTP